MKKSKPRPELPSGLWTSAQAYTLAVITLLLGIAVGYLFHGTSPAGPGAASSSSSAPASSSGGGFGSMQIPSGLSGSAPANANVEQQVQPLLATLKSNPTDFNTLVQVGNLYYDAKSYAKAVEFYERALKIHPENPDVRTDMGTAYWYQGNADRAIQEFQTSLQYQPNHADTLFNLGIVKWQGKSDAKGAVQVWETLLQKNPNYPKKDKVLSLIAQAKQET